MARQEYDFIGWATKNDIKCSDGRTIRHNAFADNDGKRVPLVWNHQHNDIDNVLGYAILKNADNGVRAYGFFNPTEKGRNAKTILEHGDITSLSIYANKLKQVGGDVIHGDIKEVSLVLAGANPGAYIDEIRHGEESVLDAVILSTGEELTIEHGEIYEDDETGETYIVSKEVDIEKIEHADEEDLTVQDVIDSMTDKQRNVLYALVGMAVNGDDNIAHADDDEDEEDIDEDSEDGETVQDVIDSMTEEQKNVLYALVGIAKKEADEEAMQHADEEDEMNDNEEEGDEMPNDEMTVQDVIDSMTEEQKDVMYALVGMAAEENGGDDEDMKHNFFAGEDDYYDEENELIHGEILNAFDDARNYGSVQKALEAHGLNKEDVLVHGVEHVDYLFPEYQNVHGNQVPFVNINPNAWVNVVKNGVHKTPFAKIKMIFADITADEARAKGYVKGALKLEQVFSLVKREVDPTTIYKKQSFDRDDILDIADNIDAIAMVKDELKVKWDEEQARAILFGDGRNIGDPDKINESKIIPVIKDTQANFYAMNKVVTPETNESVPHAIIRSMVEAMDGYEGSGNVTAFIKTDAVTSMILMEDKFGHRLYKTMDELASAMLVDKIVKVPASFVPEGFYGVALDLSDYNVGANKGGERSLFDDFDIDYNKQKYLLEGRCSGALVRPHSAIVLQAASNDSSANDGE